MTDKHHPTPTVNPGLQTSVRQRFLEVLEERLSAYPPDVALEIRQHLSRQQWWQEPIRLTCAKSGPIPSGALAKLSQLNQALRKGGPTEPLPWAQIESDQQPSLGTVRRFADAWSRLAAQQQIQQAVQAGPENAGPLNSHRLLLRSLTLMRELSPRYLRRFLAQMDALVLLDRAAAEVQQTPSTPRNRRQRVKSAP